MGLLHASAGKEHLPDGRTSFVTEKVTPNEPDLMQNRGKIRFVSRIQYVVQKYINIAIRLCLHIRT